MTYVHNEKLLQKLMMYMFFSGICDVIENPESEPQSVKKC